MKHKLTVVKIGGNVINDEALLAKVLADFSALKEAKIKLNFVAIGYSQERFFFVFFVFVVVTV